MKLLHLLHRGPGRRRLPDAYATATARVAELESMALVTAAQHQAEIDGYQGALREAAAKHDALSRNKDKLNAAYGREHAELLQLREILRTSDGRPCIHVDAPIEQGCRDTPQAASETVRDVGLLDLAESGEHGLAADLLRGLRQDRGPKPPMPGEITTARMPVVAAVLPLWDQSVPVSAITGERASASVADAVGAAT